MWLLDCGNVYNCIWTLCFAAEFHGLWESLVYDMDIKPKVMSTMQVHTVNNPSPPSQLLRYVETTLLFSDREVNSSIISWNRVVLLYGPPGTGKTSLCKALAQKLCIRLSRRLVGLSIRSYASSTVYLHVLVKEN